MENINKSSNRIESSAMWVDPDSKVTGVLLSDRIRLYVQEVGLIEPFQEKNLCPASYDLTLGTDCWHSDYAYQTGELKRTLKTGEPLVIPPNSIVFVSSAETLNLPFYLTARFNLKLRYLHEGLLIGTGPQIDPGFLGRLSCPLHNISNEKICLVCGETFAVVEFHKTTPFAQEENWTDKPDIASIRKQGESRNLKGLHGFPCVTFPSRSLNRAPIRGYLPPGKSVSSSLQDVVDGVGKFREDVERRMSTINTGAFVTLLAVVISFSAYFYATVNWNKNVNDSALRADTETKHLESELEQLQLQFNEFMRRLEAPTNHPTAQISAPGNKTEVSKP